MNAKPVPLRRLHQDEPPRTENPPVLVLSAITLVGVRFTAGDIIPESTWAKVPERNRNSLFNTRTITTDPSDIGEKESEIQEEKRATLKEAANTRDDLERIKSDRAAAEQEVRELENRISKAH